ncbi:MAG: hypothetical protein R3E01_10315 [Pirellulaceae bacterium]|nr:hypothetical protein [Planctomycetales bacterium]
MNRFTSTSYLLAITLGNYAWAASIVAPEQVVPGSLVRVQATLPTDHTADWAVFPFELDHETTPDGRLLFAAPCQGVEQIFIELREMWVEDGRVHSQKSRCTIRVDNRYPPSPPGPPEPSPPPGPDAPTPPPPEDLQGIARVAYEAVAQLTPASRALAPKIAANFQASAAAIAAGTVRSVDDALRQVQAANASTLTGVTRESWAPALETIGLRWTELINAQVIRTVKDAEKQLREVSRGMRLVPVATSMISPGADSQIEAHPPVPPQQTEIIHAPVERIVVPPPSMASPVRYRQMCVGGRCYLVPIQ